MFRRITRAAPGLLAVVALAAAPHAGLAQTPTPASAQDPAAELEALIARFEEAQEAFYDEYRALYKDYDPDAATAEEQAAFEAKVEAIRAKDPSPKFAAEFAALAERAKGTDVAAKAWMQVLQLDRSDPEAADAPSRKALERLLADHLQSAALEGLPMHLQYSQALGRKACLETLTKLKDGSPHALVKAAAMYSLALVLMNEEAQGQDKAKARQMLADLQRDHGALRPEHEKLAYAELANRYLFELDHLQLHMLAPDFEAVDETGAKFKLSDYKGKVVVIDFWGMW